MANPYPWRAVAGAPPPGCPRGCLSSVFDRNPESSEVTWSYGHKYNAPPFALRNWPPRYIVEHRVASASFERKNASRAYRLNARNGTQPRQQFTKERGPACLRISLHRQAHREGQYMAGIETRVGTLQVHQAPHEQSCGGKQRGGKGHLTDHESLARTIQAAAFTCRLRPFLQAVHQICFGSPKCRSKTENDCRSYRYENSESEYSDIE